MDVTDVAAQVFDAVPANVAYGLSVVRAADGAAEVSLAAGPAWARVGGALHASGLMALVDATGLAALVSAVTAADQFAGVSALATAAQLEFRRLAGGPLHARCTLNPGDLAAVRSLRENRSTRALATTAIEIRDAGDRVVCTGALTWKLRNRVPAS